MNYPQELLRDIYWSFANGTFSSQKKFLKELKKYYKEIAGNEIPLDLDKVIYPYPKMVIQYMKYNYADEDWDEPQVLLRSEEEKGFTAGELLYKIHNTIGKHLATEDNCYFEGLTFGTDQDPDYPDTAVYFLDTGT